MRSSYYNGFSGGPNYVALALVFGAGVVAALYIYDKHTKAGVRYG